MERNLGRVLSVYAYALLGLFLLVAPWTPVWEQAAHGLLPESFRAWALSGWLRGIVSGLGALDLFVAAQFGGELFRQKKGGVG